MITAIVMIAPDLSAEPEKMHSWQLERKTLGHAMHTCLRRFKRRATKGKVYRVTALRTTRNGRPAKAEAMTRRLRF